MNAEAITASTPARGQRLTIAAWFVAAITTALSLASIVLEIVGPGPSATSADPDAGAGGVLLVTIQSVMAAAFTVLGALVVSRQPRNPVGWLLVLIGFFFMYIAASNELYMQVVLNGGSTTGFNAYVMWGGNWAWLFCMVPAGTLLPLLFPTGRPLTPRWRLIVWLTVAAIALSFVSSAFKVGPLDGAEAVVNPLGIDSPAIALLGRIGGYCFVPALLGSFASLVLRFRRSSGAERQQIKWVASAAALIPIVAVPGLSFGGEAGWPLILIAMLIVAIAVTVAMLRYRLYDIDVVINKAVVFALLAGFITAVYAGVVVGLGRLLPVGQDNLGLAIMATALVAVAFEPVRVRVQHWANRLVYGQRATPYEALAAMTGRIGASADAGSALPEAARLLAEGTGAAESVVWVAEDGVLVPRAVAGDGAGTPEPVRLHGEDVPERAGVLMQAVRHEGQLVGALSLTKRPGEGVSSADRRLLEDLAGQASMLLANTRLRSRLGDRLEELRTSRQRMLVAQDRARHALERDLHDGAQQELVALKVKLGLARTIATRESASGVADRLSDAAGIADQAVDTLRDVARGIYPPLLESEGLAAALSAQARGSDLAVTVLDRTDMRYSRDIEATAFFCVREALRNAAEHSGAEHAHVELGGDDTHLSVVVSDDGAGFDPHTTPLGDGLTHMIDRADAAGGVLDIDSQPGHGTTITLTLPTYALLTSAVDAEAPTVATRR
jgi:signal transduction histidine kinase